MLAEVISIGDEITSGQTLDTNSQWLSQRLEELGLPVLYHSVVGDDLKAMTQVFRTALERSDVVVCTGGLGPTADDLTRDALAEAASRRLVLDPDALESIRRLFASRKREMPRRNEIQARFPEGSRVIPNPHGTAPGIDLEFPRGGAASSRFFALPGVPAEMKEMWDLYVAPVLREFGAGSRMLRHRKINCFGAGESQIEAMLPNLIERGREPRVGITASQTIISLRITAGGTTEEECFAAMEPTVAVIRERLGRLVFGEGDEQLQDAVVRLLRERNRTLATFEWGTSGQVADRLGSTPDAASHFLSGIIFRDSRALERVSKIPLALSTEFPERGEELAAAMASACREHFGADLGLAISPFPPFDSHATEPKPVFLGLATAEETVVKSIPFALHPAILKVYCANHALNLVRLRLLEG